MSHLTDVDRVRLLIGDTDVEDAILSDEEIEAFVEYRQMTTVEGDDITNVPAAAADCALAIAGKFAREFNFAEDGQRFDRAQKHGHYLALEALLRRRAGGSSVPYTTT